MRSGRVSRPSLRRLAAAQVTHELHAGLDDIGRLAESLGIDQAMIGGIGLGEFGEAPGSPVELAAVHDDAAHLQGMAVHILGGGVDDDVGTEIEGAAEHRRGKGIVHDQGQAVTMRQGRDTFDVQHVHGRIGQGLAEHRLGVGADGLFDLGVIGPLIHEGHFDAHFLQRHGEQVEGTAVDAGHADHMVAAPGQVEDGDEIGRLPRRSAQGTDAAFQSRDLLLHGVHRGVAQTGVEKAGSFQVKKLGHFGRGVIGKGRALHDGHYPGLTILGSIARMQAKRFGFHGFLVP